MSCNASVDYNGVDADCPGVMFCVHGTCQCSTWFSFGGPECATPSTVSYVLLVLYSVLLVSTLALFVMLARALRQVSRVRAFETTTFVLAGLSICTAASSSALALYIAIWNSPLDIVLMSNGVTKQHRLDVVSAWMWVISVYMLIISASSLTYRWLELLDLSRQNARLVRASGPVCLRIPGVRSVGLSQVVFIGSGIIVYSVCPFSYFYFVVITMFVYLFALYAVGLARIQSVLAYTTSATKETSSTPPSHASSEARGPSAVRVALQRLRLTAVRTMVFFALYIAFESAQESYQYGLLMVSQEKSQQGQLGVQVVLGYVFFGIETSLTAFILGWRPALWIISAWLARTCGRARRPAESRPPQDSRQSSNALKAPPGTPQSARPHKSHVVAHRTAGAAVAEVSLIVADSA